jgi:hypothetical protein
MTSRLLINPNGVFLSAAGTDVVTGPSTDRLFSTIKTPHVVERIEFATSTPTSGSVLSGVTTPRQLIWCFRTIRGFPDFSFEFRYSSIGPAYYYQQQIGNLVYYFRRPLFVLAMVKEAADPTARIYWQNFSGGTTNVYILVLDTELT